MNPDGVGCESCHGASRNWLGPHTTEGWKAIKNRAQKKKQGLLDTKDLALWMKAPAEQAFVRDIGADDALPPVRGDSFGVIVQNGGGSKIDNYLQRTIRYSTWAVTSGLTARDGDLGSEVTLTAARLPPRPESGHQL